MKHSCGGKIDFVSIVKKDDKMIELTMVCTECGESEIEKHYLYDDTELCECELFTVEKMDFTVRTYNTLKRGNVNTLDDLLRLGSDGVRSVRNMATKCFNEIDDKVKEYGYYSW